MSGWLQNWEEYGKAEESVNQLHLKKEALLFCSRDELHTKEEWMMTGLSRVAHHLLPQNLNDVRYFPFRS
ncbi:hypothetical protein X798_04103, partial [Onchocerca flexuosa]